MVRALPAARPPFVVRRVRRGPLLAVALHAGHDLRDEVARALAVGDAERLREEDPFTDVWTNLAGSRVVVSRSRFEVDCNRPREKAVYRDPEDAWGLAVWREPPAEDLVARSLAVYDAFYAAMERLCGSLRRRHGRFLVYDLHTYNERGDPSRNPEVNLGTGSLPPARAAVARAFLRAMRARGFDARENVRFTGGHFARWVHARFPGSGCALAIEVKKTLPHGDAERIAEVGVALASTVAPALEALFS